ncbi:uncharacterized protein LOC124358873 [Homalodisca vitripennis]|uniref:uncharacterized protein LOC124358873 n=1 Tax=Homalodisca vitripennis TaxID=197043 RepID=UPI001EEB3201|nr:uncharacterized protein LOC124358873 [Homalodisca vitripennis]
MFSEHRFSTQHVVEEKKATPVPQFEVPNSTHVYEDEKMDIDLVVDELEPNQDLPTTNIKESCNISSDNSDVPLLQNNLHSHLQELMVDLQAFLHAVLDEALQNLYGDLKHHANNIRLSWTPINYIVETSKRWSMISSHPITPRIRDIFSKIIASVKKYRSAREDFTVADVVSTFSLCEDLANLFAKKYTKSTDIFLTNLQNHREEWEADYKSSLSMLSVDSNSVENDLSIQPVDLALQNIKNCLRTDYEDWKERVESGNASDVDSLTLFYENIANFVVTLKRILGTENPKTFTITSEIVIRLHKAVTCFSDAQGNKFGFDCTVENVLELLQDNSYRKNLEQSLDSFIKLEKQVDGLLDIIDDL